MEPKPLTKERREAYRKLNSPAGSAIDELLAAEAYWREEIKKCEPTAYFGVNDNERCFFCMHHFYESVPRDRAESHEPNCPWLLAQETES